MTDTPQLSGRDLARQALASYKATARTAPTSTPARSKTRRTVRTGSGREPITFAQAIAGLGAEIPLEAGVAGGSVIDQWPTLCPQYFGLVQPVSYDERTGRLDLRPGSHSYAAQLRLLGGQLAKQINDKLGRAVVRTIRVLPVGNVATAERPAAPPELPPPKRRYGPGRPYRRATAGPSTPTRPPRQTASPPTRTWSTPSSARTGLCPTSATGSPRPRSRTPLPKPSGSLAPS